jgi:sulfur relay (sulfurtransferase) DsrC/TusE family protein
MPLYTINMKQIQIQNREITFEQTEAQYTRICEMKVEGKLAKLYFDEIIPFFNGKDDFFQRFTLSPEELKLISEIKKEMEKPSKGNMRAMYAESEYESEIGHGVEE